MKHETDELSEVGVRGRESSGEAATHEAPELRAPTAEEELADAGNTGDGQSTAAGQAEIDQLKTERDQLVDRLARLQAEFENARKRADRERAEAREFVTGSVIEQFLPVLDNFELALKSTGSVQQMRSGVSLIVKQMEEILQKMQVSAVTAVGETFDPRIHEALGSVDREDVPDQQVVEEVRRGYKLRERLLRPALVRVAHNAKQVSD
jgi:molecular chaperone GrpE